MKELFCLYSSTSIYNAWSRSLTIFIGLRLDVFINDPISPWLRFGCLIIWIVELCNVLFTQTLIIFLWKY